MISPESFKRILVVRNDRLGDLVLTTPLFAALRQSFPQANISCLIAPCNFEVIRENPHLDEILLDDYERNASGFRYLVKDLRRREFEAALLAVPSLRMTLALAASGIRLRAGPATHLYCRILLNRTLAQHRSRADRHEAQYNLDLLRLLGADAPAFAETFVTPLPEDIHWAAQKISSLKAQGKKLVIVHPVCGGSALNWPDKQWAELIRLFRRDRHFFCLVTGAISDRITIRKILALAEQPEGVSLAGETSLGRLAALLCLSHAFVGPSTGPMHLAASCGTFTVAIFSPMISQSARRWGPYGTGKKKVFAPDVICPARFRCLGPSCRHYFCMELIRPEDVYREIRELLAP